MDLQSPQYVKRTAHMFDLRYTSQLNESHGTAENIERNPSYLNVSRSVCGYSCLSYNNGTSTTKANNASSTTLMNTPKAPPFPPKFTSGIRSDLSITLKSNSHKDEEDVRNHSQNGSSPQPPPLPKSTVPKYAASINIGESDSSSLENGKSFIMQKIERLYGSDAVSSTGFLWKRSSISSDERIIPISLESRNNDGNNKNKLWKSQPKEQTLYSTRRCSSQAYQDAPNDTVSHSATSTLYSKNKIPVDESNISSDIKNTMFVQEEIPKESNVNNFILNKREQPHYENTHKTANDSGLGDKDLNSELDNESAVNNEDFNRIRRNGNFRDFDAQSGEPTRVTSAISFEEAVSVSSVGSTADDSGLGEGEERVPFSAKIKPIPKPKPKDMALRRSARNVDKGAAISSKNEDIIGKDVTDSEVKILKHPSQPANLETFLDSLIDKQTIPTSVDIEVKPFIAGKENEDVEKNGTFFLNETRKAAEQIEEQILKATKELEQEDDPNSELAGRIRAAIGKANLLIKKKFKQFNELCHANLAEQAEKAENKPFQTKNEDLAGFWDMVCIQIEEIFHMFSELRNKNLDSSFTDQSVSVSETPVKTASSTRRVGNQTAMKSLSKSSAPAKSSAAAARDESRRRLLAEKRRALKNQTAAPKPTEEAEVQIFVPESNERI